MDLVTRQCDPRRTPQRWRCLGPRLRDSDRHHGFGRLPGRHGLQVSRHKDGHHCPASGHKVAWTSPGCCRRGSGPGTHWNPQHNRHDGHLYFTGLVTQTKKLLFFLVYLLFTGRKAAWPQRGSNGWGEEIWIFWSCSISVLQGKPKISFRHFQNFQFFRFFLLSNLLIFLGNI